MDQTAETLIAGLRSRGLRITRARRAICTAVAAAAGEQHSAGDLMSRAEAAAGAAIDRSTVYRTLDVLEELGYLHHVHLEHGPAVYHAAHPDEHHHLLCVQCGRSVDVPIGELADPLAAVAGRRGFAPEGIRAVLRGTCRACADRATGS